MTCSGLARVSVDLNGVSSLSEASEQWTEDRVRQLEEDKAVIERLWGEHAQENDIGVLKFKLVCNITAEEIIPIIGRLLWTQSVCLGVELAPMSNCRPSCETRAK